MLRTITRFLALITVAAPLLAQAPASDQAPESTLRITSRAVLVDVVVSDHNGKPVTGLKQDAFTVTEQDKPQSIGFFEEHTAAPPAAPPEIPKLPTDVFSNFSPYPLPAAVNVLLLDSLNTRMESQSFVHQQALKFLKDSKPGARMAIFTLGLGLHFVQGFTDDPTLLFAALNNKKNNDVQASMMIKGQDETNAQKNLVGMMSAPEGNGATAASPDMIADLQKFILENDGSREVDRVLLTMQNLQRLATFLNGFPGRKNVIWFTESPLVAGRVDPQSEKEWQKTRNMLAAARVALYPVDARGAAVNSVFTASNNPNPSIGNASQLTADLAGTTLAEDQERNAEQSQMQRVAEETGGRAFVNGNGLAEVMARITSDSSDFYTLSYAPTDAKMDGGYRTIDVKVAGGKYNVSFRRGYYALDAGVPGAALATRDKEIHKLAAENPGAVDPLLPFMDLGMPQSEQILYMARIQPIAAKADAPEQNGKTDPSGKPDQGKKNGGGQAYAIDFSIDLKDLDLKLDADGQHKGTLNVSLIAYDRYGHIAARKDHLVALNIKPDIYAVFQQSGVQLHAEIEMPKGQYWLRTGVYDQGSRKVGTMEVALSSVVPAQTAAK